MKANYREKDRERALKFILKKQGDSQYLLGRLSTQEDLEESYQELLSLIHQVERDTLEGFKEIIGEDESKHEMFCFPDDNEPCTCGIEHRNELRAELRTKLLLMKEKGVRE